MATNPFQVAMVVEAEAGQKIASIAQAGSIQTSIRMMQCSD
jgi:hypothetical protein